jgi:ATP-dependent helicase/nuclease subunit B
MRLYAIPAGTPFLPALAKGAIAMVGLGEALARTTILLPTQRAARGLRAAFLEASGQPALVLPRMRALAGLSTEDADELSLPALLDLPPAVQPLRRQAVLAAMVSRRPPRTGGPNSAAQAWQLAGELATLLDEIALESRDELPAEETALTEDVLARLDQLAPADLAQHWEITTLFLRGVAQEWTAWLRENDLMDIGLRRVLALRLQRLQWEDKPPTDAIIAAGIGAGGTIPAAVSLLRSIATKLPKGAVVLPAEDSVTAAVEPDILLEACTHPFGGHRRLLRDMGAIPEDLAVWPGSDEWEPSPRSDLLGVALLPHQSLGPWLQREPERWKPALEGFTLLEASDAHGEAAAIALEMRRALETPGAKVALVTPDRDLACRVAAELPRHGIVADDSAGTPLSRTPAGAFLRLLAEAVSEEFAPVPLLALLKHPLCAAGRDRRWWLRAVHRLERGALRGPRPRGGLEGLREAVALRMDRPEDRELASELLTALEDALGDFGRTSRGARLSPAEILQRHLAAAEALASTPDLPGGLRLYANEEGEPLAKHLHEMSLAFEHMNPLPMAEWSPLFEASLGQGTARCLRVTRGRDGLPTPQVEILGLLEARLLDFDCVVLGALDETVWPLAADPGPWMSRPMRRDFGLPEPEMRIGRVAADFVMAATSAREVVMSRAGRRGGSPAVAARWITRLRTFLAGQGLAIPASHSPNWAAGLDAPRGGPRPVDRPAPCPPAEARPRRLTVSDIESLINDPYAFYARRILRLSALDDLDADPGAAEYGQVVHAAMRYFLDGLPRRWPGDGAALELWDVATEKALEEESPTPALDAIWRARLARIGEFVVNEERPRRPDIRRTHTEVEARTVLARPLGAIEVDGRADRLDEMADGSLRILDYKTGQLPSREAVRDGTAPQLPVEAWLAEGGAFERVPAAPISALEYWRLSGGGAKPGEVVRLHEGRQPLDTGQAIEAARAGVERLADEFLLGSACFTARPHPKRDKRSDYDHLARTDEWSSEGDAE